MNIESMALSVTQMVYDKHPNADAQFIQNETLRLLAIIHNDINKLKGYDNIIPLETLNNTFTATVERTPIGDSSGAKPKRQYKKSATDYSNFENWSIQDPEEIQKSVKDTEIICCCCGRTYSNLSVHLKTHNITMEEYRKMANFPEDTPLMSKEYFEKMSKRMRRRIEDDEPQKKIEGPVTAAEAAEAAKAAAK